MFLVPSMQEFTNAFSDPYFKEVVEPDEHNFLDKEGPGQGVVSTFKGELFDLVVGGRSVLGNEGKAKECWGVWEEYEKTSA
jgi:hypothetical protein